jgi:uncharacterized protein (TIGR03437 family)
MRYVPSLFLFVVLRGVAMDSPDNRPELLARDVVNAADYSGGGVAPGEVVVLFPSNAGPPDMVPWGLDANLKRPTLIGDTRVLFDNIAAMVLYSRRGQVGAIVPRSVAGRKTTEVVIEYQGKRSPPAAVPVIVSAPALFTLDASGKGQAAMLNDTGCCNSVRNPAVRGSAASLYATGEGRIAPGRIARNISVTVGGVPARVLYTADAGALQVNFRIPENAPVGDAVPLVLKVGVRESAQAVTMAVRSARQRVLVLDGDAAVRRRLARILGDAGYEVLAADTQTQPDLVILNLEMSHEPTLERVRAINPQLRILAVSSTLGPSDLRAADVLGAQTIITTPLNETQFLFRVRSLLRRKPAVY